MINQLVVEGLNNRADGTHDLQFHPDLNIFTGPNGSGKTTLLKLIWYLISGNLERVLTEIPFDFVSIETSVFSLDMNQVKPGEVGLNCKFAEKGEFLAETKSRRVLSSETRSSNRNSKYFGMHRGYIVLDCRAERAKRTPWSELVRKHGVKDATLKNWVKRAQHLTKAEDIHALLAPKNAQPLSQRMRTLTVDSETGDLNRIEDEFWLNAINQRIALGTKSSLFFPTFRRIEGGFSRGFRHSTPIRRMSSRATERLQEGMSGLSEEVSVANHKFVSSISTDDIASLLAQRYAAIAERINELQVELSAEIKQKIRDHSGDGTSVLSAIQESVQRVDDGRESELKPFSVLANLTQEILQYQSIEVTGRILRDEGAERIVLGKGKDGIALGQVESIISSDKLSAGEKQMLSFLCYNAFSDNAAIFIDEPELSLHVDWQGLLLPTLLEQATGNQFFVATHSPFIYTIYPDKEFLLGDNRGYQGKI